MRTKHKYDKDFSLFLMTMDETQFLEWLKTNEVIYDEPDLMKVISKDIEEETNNKN